MKVSADGFYMDDGESIFIVGILSMAFSMTFVLASFIFAWGPPPSVPQISETCIENCKPYAAEWTVTQLCLCATQEPNIYREVNFDETINANESPALENNGN